ncbi:hypothetical protein Lal_00038670 [Lupinus albus]|nr:hypothetical protein Lal_00038670 [Lupinus albus]
MASIVHIISKIWYCRNQSRFHDKFFPETPQVFAYNSLREFSILKSLSISIKFSKAPSITEVMWKSPTRNWIKVNPDGPPMVLLAMLEEGSFSELIGENS